MQQAIIMKKVTPKNLFVLSGHKLTASSKNFGIIIDDLDTSLIGNTSFPLVMV